MLNVGRTSNDGNCRAAPTISPIIHTPIPNYSPIPTLTYAADITVMLRPAILDVQGKTVENALHTLGYAGASHVRVGKHVTLAIEAGSQEEAEQIAREMAERVLSNPIIEDFVVAVRATSEQEAEA